MRTFAGEHPYCAREGSFDQLATFEAMINVLRESLMHVLSLFPRQPHWISLVTLIVTCLIVQDRDIRS